MWIIIGSIAAIIFILGIIIPVTIILTQKVDLTETIATTEMTTASTKGIILGERKVKHSGF
jgi:hypothetical protein